MLIRKAEHKDLKELLDIYNYEVIHDVSTFDIHPKTLEEWEQWFYAHNVDNHPLLVAEIDHQAAGYASLSPYREKEAYYSTVELSVYINIAYRNRGVATELMRAINDMAKKDVNTHVVISVITDGNEISEKLHEKFGFTCSGTLHEVGYKMGAYRNVKNYELLI